MWIGGGITERSKSRYVDRWRDHREEQGMVWGRYLEELRPSHLQLYQSVRAHQSIDFSAARHPSSRSAISRRGSSSVFRVHQEI
jgi:hypothetical protein